MSDSQIYTDRDCMETGSGCSLKGKVVVLKNLPWRLALAGSFITVWAGMEPMRMP